MSESTDAPSTPPPPPVVTLPPPTAAKASHASIFEDAEHRYPALIEWTQPCESIGVTGSFNGWGSQILLKKQKADPADAVDSATPAPRFAITLYLPVGTHFFKFCVDGAWQYDPEVTFAPDEYGNLNNFIKILPIGGGGAAKLKPLQRALRTMIRDSKQGLPVMNPAATEELMKVRLQTSPVLHPQRSPVKTSARQRESRSEPPAITPLPPPRKPLDTTDVEFDLNVDAIRQNSQKNLLQPRSRSGTLTRSKSEESLVTALAAEDHAPKYSNYVDDAITSSVLLAATTQHFGGDLVTHEHSTRAKLGGHRSIVMPAPRDGHKTEARRSSGKLIIFLVGLPGRGKTFIGHILSRHLTWMGHHSKVFSTGEYRRKMIGASVNHAFWDPLNAESYNIRTELSKKCLEDSLSSLEQDLCDCVIFDATNVTRARRSMLLEQISARYKCEVMFIESICDLPEVVAFSINEMKLNSEDYAGQTLEEAAADYHNRINHYRTLYEPLSAEVDNFPFIKVIDVGRQIFCNQMYGYLQSRIMFLMANLNLRPRPIWLSRHGESMYNTQKRIGGDSPLSPHGLQYAMQLDRFIDAYYPAPGTELAVWTSTMLRTGMTVERIAARGRSVVKWKQLDEIDAGVCDGMTYEQVAEEMPEEYLARKHNKLHYRYPRGESYQDVIHRLEPVITELMRIDQPVLIVAHQAILRVVYAYLTNKDPSECPTVNIPLHVVIQLTPRAYHCEEVWHRPM